MNGKLKSALLKYGIAVLVAGVLTWAYLALRDFSSVKAAVDRYRLLCDAFTVPGVLLMLTAALIALTNEGALSGIGYMLGHAVRMLIPGMGARKDEKYADYIERKAGSKVKGYGFIFYTGAVWFAVGMIYLALFYRHFNG